VAQSAGVEGAVQPLQDQQPVVDQAAGVMGGGQLLQDQQQDGIDSGVGDKRNTQMGSEGEALRRRLDLLEAAADAESWRRDGHQTIRCLIL
jgi:hypothetical protein